MTNQDQLQGCLLGIALGDSLGLPTEGLSAARARKLFPGVLRQRMVAGRGVLSDDTLTAAVTLQAMYSAPDDSARFATELARRLRLWFWSAPPGIGLATLKACIRLSVGFDAAHSGVRSAGNGAAIRAVVLGCALSGEPEKRIEYIRQGTRITHTLDIAEQGTQLVGLAAALSAVGQSDRFQLEAEHLIPSWPWKDSYPSSGPTGYIVYTVNAAIGCWKMHPNDLAQGLEMAVALGGDTDSVAAIVGGIIGSSGSAANVPAEWNRWLGWPQARDLANLASGSKRNLPMGRLIGQHVLSLALILPHAARRIFPPY